MKVLLGSSFVSVNPSFKPYPNYRVRVIRSAVVETVRILVPELCMIADGSSGSIVGPSLSSQVDLEFLE
jgi:hypothetical protein